MLERVELSTQIHYCMWTLQSIMNDVQRLVCSQGAVVIVRQLAQLVRNSLHGVQPNCSVPPHYRGHAELAKHAPLHPEKERILGSLQSRSEDSQAPNEREPPTHGNFRST